jgi:hypothetical protein
LIKPKVKGTKREILTKIDQKVGMRLLTNFATKGVINLVKVAPIVGGLVGAGINVVSSQQIAKQATKMFIGQSVYTQCR